MFGAYRQALRAPGALAFYLAAGPARVGVAMTGLGLVWLVHGSTGSYGRAGLAAGAFAVTEALIGPQVARLIDCFGQTRVVPPLLVAHGAFVAGLVAGRSPVVLAALAGATIPQVGALAAARWSRVLAGPLLGTGFALEAIANGIAFLVGPALVGIVAATVGPAAGTALAAVLVVAGGLALSCQPASAPPPAGRLSGHAGPPRGIGTLVTVNGALGMVFGALQVSVTAFAVDHGGGSLAGPLYAITSAASLLSGFVYGRRPRRLQLRTAFALLAAGCVPLLVADSPAALAVALALPGFAIAPILTLSAVLTETRVERGVLTQAFTWLNSASAAGVAAAAALSGQLVDALGTTASFGLAVAAAALATAPSQRGYARREVPSS